MHIGDTGRFNGTHKECGGKFSALTTTVPAPAPAWFSYQRSDGQIFEAWTNDSSRLVYVCKCGQRRLASRVLGKINRDKKCNAKCLASVGHDCECSCGGKNHGASHGS